MAIRLALDLVVSTPSSGLMSDCEIECALLDTRRRSIRRGTPQSRAVAEARMAGKPETVEAMPHPVSCLPTIHSMPTLHIALQVFVEAGGFIPSATYSYLKAIVGSTRTARRAGR